MEYLNELCEDLEIDPRLQKSESGFYLLPLTDSVTIEIKSLNPGVFFYSPICPCPEIKQEDLFINLMKANLFGQGTLGAGIGIKEDQSLLTLSKAMAYDMNYRAFRESLEDFTNILEYWRVEVQRHIDLAKGDIL